ncbi:importin subunit alpha [Arabidopsis thaliana]|uniref:Importin subunit alpha n=1 Tax=Arabidopsis thaliana TaxID=3702 RepID=A0A1P8BDF2_ARATH|nr:importin subunit alpha [Arabidopsis thaliana]NP_001331294.1 importin subunit alpha [Arabidopsis thaliana]NP_001331295.1 importin subunit alpha [Arabidopsis thaliana]NP_001331296.1 importin subunit alpha [Arabidopsis thaliana]NP_001331297.1 importin subunit alpha [Arabidopsis thaliana]ANM69630.1 importin subunit alpha [Arabidopsis thaliana]ANM69631.1 importin subunit alpha [Arabidopsis thaliana]ANM69632.1 importin subunit alpha [Arabidopsis thaliana]ANM69633.1 importin subunit alpha [Arab|eukprot:NP_001331293.1 importin subunit alpha [Arabidopsis thaliana]
MSLANGLYSKDPLIQLDSAIKINRILSDGMQRNLPLGTKDLIRSGIVARFVFLLHNEEFPKLQFEAARGLAIIAAFKPDVVVDHKVVPILVTLLASSTDNVRGQAILALGNVAYHPIHRDYVLQCGALTPLLIRLYKDTNLPMLRAAIRTLAFLCRGMPPSTFNEVKPALEIHLNSSDKEILRYVCLAISHLCYGSVDGIQRVIQAGFVPKLVSVLRRPSPVLSAPELRTIGTLVTGNNHQSQLLIDANLIPSSVNLALNAELDIKREAVRVILRATVGGSPNQIKYLVQQGCTKLLCDLLVCPDIMIIKLCLYGLKNILKAGESEKNRGDVNYYRQLIDAAEGVKKIKNLLKHERNEIYDKALNILETYWDVEDDEKTQKPPR